MSNDITYDIRAKRNKRIRRLMLALAPVALVGGLIGGGAIDGATHSINNNKFGLPSGDKKDDTANEVSLAGDPFDVSLDASAPQATETWTITNKDTTRDGHGSLEFDSMKIKDEDQKERAKALSITYHISGKDVDGGTMDSPTDVPVSMPKGSGADKPGVQNVGVTVKYDATKDKTGGENVKKKATVGTTDFRLNYHMSPNAS